MVHESVNQISVMHDQYHHVIQSLSSLILLENGSDTELKYV